jgi:hypothetical protein
MQFCQRCRNNSFNHTQQLVEHHSRRYTIQDWDSMQMEYVRAQKGDSGITSRITAKFCCYVFCVLHDICFSSESFSVQEALEMC